MRPTEYTVHEVKELMEADSSIRLLDVREDFELRIASLPQAEHLTESVANQMLAGSDRDTPCIFMCHHGVRSLMAADFFARNGFKNVSSMAGGIDAWSREIDSSVPTY